MTTRTALKLKTERIWITLPAIAMTAADAGVTLLLQPSGYWQQGYHLAVENNPMGASLMRLHPLLFMVGILGWIALIAMAVRRLPHPWERVIALTVILGHTWGVSIWLYSWALSAYWPRMAVFLAIALFTALCWRRADRLSGDWRPGLSEVEGLENRRLESERFSK